MTITLSHTSLVKDIVNAVPKTSDVFKKYRIDFCCGGNISLDEAIVDKKVSMDDLLQELNVVSANASQDDNMEIWTDSSSEQIIEHVINHYHRLSREELDALSPYVTKVARVHGDNHPELIKVYELFYEFKKELLSHMDKEEATSFPNIMKLEDPNVENKEAIREEIIELEKEHDHAGNILRELREVTKDYELPFDACGTYTLVYKRLEALESFTFMHVHLENNILFPRYF
jgi:regulator of cell morphogenesis and NO signaling